MSLNPLEPWSIKKMWLCGYESWRDPKDPNSKSISTQIISNHSFRSRSDWTHRSHGFHRSEHLMVPRLHVPATSVQPANLGHQFQDDFRCSSTKPIHALITQAIIQQITLARIIPKGFAMDKSCGKPKKRRLGKVGNGLIAWFIVGYTAIWDGFSLSLPH